MSLKFKHQAIEQDPDLPSYLSEEYLNQLPFWEFVADMYEGRTAWYMIEPFRTGSSMVLDINIGARYLPREEAEPEEEYAKRMTRSYFDRKFADAIDSSAGFLSRFLLNDDVHESIKTSIDNVDLCGNSLEVFLKAADIKSLRDDHCFVMVDFPKRNTEITDAYTESKYKTRPYFLLIDARDVINWNTEIKNNKMMVTQATVRETFVRKTGLYGSEKATRYRVLTPGAYKVYEIEETEETPTRTDLILVEEGTTTLDFVPLIPYCLLPRDSDFFTGKPPLYDIAELNLKLFQKQSEKDEAMHKANMAILQIQETSPPRVRSDKDEARVATIGPNTCLWNVNASFVEPSGSALGHTQADIEKLELTIEKKTLAFQSGYAAPPTATEIARDSATAQASLGSMARAKESIVQQLFDTWCLYMNAPGKGGTIKVNKKIVEVGMSEAKAGLLLQIRAAGEITRQTFLEELRKGDVLSKDFDVDAEVEELESKMKQEMATQLSKATALANDNPAAIYQ